MMAALLLLAVMFVLAGLVGPDVLTEVAVWILLLPLAVLRVTTVMKLLVPLPVLVVMPRLNPRVT